MAKLHDELGVSENATPEEIKEAWKKAALSKHPDHTGGDDTEFKRIQNAYLVLRDPVRRAEYERTGDEGEASRSPEELERQKALELTAGLLSIVLDEEGFDVEKDSLTEAMRSILGDQIARAQDEKGALERRKQRIKKARKRLRKKKGEGTLLESMLDKKKADAKQALTLLESKLRVYTIAGEIIDEYGYEVDARPPRSSLDGDAYSYRDLREMIREAVAASQARRGQR